MEITGKVIGGKTGTALIFVPVAMIVTNTTNLTIELN